MAKLAQRIYEDLVGRRGSSHDTAKHWKTWTERFEAVCGTKERYDRTDIIRFLAWEREQGFSESTIKVHLRPLHLLAQIQGWDFPKMTFRKIKASEITRTIFTKDQVVSLIQMGRRILEPNELSWLALATTYGLRREELGKPEPPEIIDGQVTIHTVKGGPQTT
ncbi:MAG TPA: hypothetical protein ENI27_07475, partial [bacterium]|nr:hypothetical protein [bacterium]